jgi:geranylgeranyl reductase family protein
MNREFEPIAIIGGGPAGALAAEHLARAGRKVVLFDDKLAWEKPCGGGITPKAFIHYPYLADAEVERNWIDSCELISPNRRRIVVEFEQKLAIYSRKVLNGMMLDRARQAGAELVADHVQAIDGTPGSWRLPLRSGAEVKAAFVVVATGARNPFRARFTRRFLPEELLITVGYYIPGTSHRMQVRFVPDLEGYIWTFPRRDHFSAGIGGRLGDRTTAELRRILENFLDEEGFAYRGSQFYSHILPAPNAATLNEDPFCGEGWAMIGDAAGFVDPITGEGIYYALRSAELAARAIAAGCPEKYQSLLAEALLPELTAAAGYADRFFCGTLFGQPVLERLVQYTGESRKFRSLIADLFAGAQAYVSLKGRCYQELLPVLWQKVSG